MKIHEVITKETWCQGSFAVTEAGRTIGPLEKNAVKWCALGWIHKVYSTSGNCMIIEDRVRNYIQSRVEDRVRNSTHAWVSDWNDSPERTFEEVLAVFKELHI
jgi:hypothetical protein